jgi:hypothetical protein
MTCRVFGPPLRSFDDEGHSGLGVCELCFHGATPEEIAACEVHLDVEDQEATLITEAECATGLTGNTVVAWALLA